MPFTTLSRLSSNEEEEEEEEGKGAAAPSEQTVGRADRGRRRRP